MCCRGGSKVVKTNASLTYDKTDGLYYNRYYGRLMLRVNNDIQINKYLNAKLDFNFKRAKNHSPGFIDNSSFTESIMIENVRHLPAIWCAIRDDGKYGYGRDGGNPYARLHESGDKDEWYNQVGGRIALGAKPFDGLTLSVIVSPTYNFDKIKTFRKARLIATEEDPDIFIGTDPDLPTTKLVENRNDNYNVTKQFLINYMKSFGKHDLNVMSGYEDYYVFYENLMASRDQYELNNFPYLNIGPLSHRDNSGSAQEVAYRSWFGRIVYNYDNRYLLQANIRRDGSSRFSKDYRWGNFPSFSAGWILSEEQFMKEVNLNWLSFLKLRGSYGTLGNERILDSNGNQNYYPYQAAMGFGNMLFFQNGQPISQLTAAQQYYAIQSISWEKTKTYDIGLDANFLNNRLHFIFDYYKKTTEDMLLSLEIPDFVGFDNPQQNTGDMYTKGYEIELGWSDKIGDFSYSVSANFSDNVSRMGYLGGTEFLGDRVKFEGSEFDEWYGYLSDGLILTEEDLNSPKLNNSITYGDVKYKDISGPDGVPDAKISSDYDRVLLGGSLPRFLYGGNVTLGYRGIDLSMAFQGIGRQNVRYIRQLTEPCWGMVGSVPTWIDGNFWSVSNTDEQNAAVKFPRVSSTSSNSNYTMSDLWLFNGRYFRVKNITLGYTLPAMLTNKVMIKRARVYVSANDILTVSKYPTGWDPEISG
ncbi:MAG: SusC/RagA family TonB-linked outer membrane protein, partial [Parabacteroides gordonii]|nr:SusC/RagA family TonB-linked outer membrane protein [Parabacteroides gordonii]